MHHIPLDDHRRTGCPAVPRALAYLLLAALGLAAAYEINPALSALLGLTIGLGLAFVARMGTPGGPGRGAPAAPSGLLLGDGGAFPGGAPVPDRPAGVRRPTVLDGGTLGRHDLRPPRTATASPTESFSKSPNSKVLNESPSH